MKLPIIPSKEEAKALLEGMQYGKAAELEWRVSDYMQEHSDLIRRLSAFPV